MSELESPKAVSSVKSAPAPDAGSNRLMSLDVFRGATIAAMLLVNNPGTWSAIYPPFKHAAWHGWTFTDIIFPFFLWIVGMAIPLSLVRRLEQGEAYNKIVLRIVRRTVLLFGLGLFLHGFPFFHLGLIGLAPLPPEGVGFFQSFWERISTIRIPGVLQRIAVCYCVAAFVVLHARVRGQILWTAGFLVVYSALMMFYPVPGYGAGVLEKEGNFAQYIDQMLLSGHMWQKTWDPEGLVSTLPAIATTLFGVLTGQVLRSRLSIPEKTVWFFVMGALLMFAGQLLKYWIPINKPLWTPSYALFMAGLASTTFAVCYWLIDVRGHRAWAKPFAIYGMNAITAFVLAGLLGRITINVSWINPEGKTVLLKTWIFETFFLPLASPMNASLLYSLMYVALFFGISYFLYRRKWFIRL